MVAWVSRLLVEFLGTREVFSLSSSPRVLIDKEVWCPPPYDCLKPNYNASIPHGRDVFGAGAVFRNTDGGVVLALSKLLHGCFEVEVCEVVALHTGLELARRHGLSISLVEVDVSRVTAAGNSSKPSSSVGSFISMIFVTFLRKGCWGF